MRASRDTALRLQLQGDEQLAAAQAQVETMAQEALLMERRLSSLEREGEPCLAPRFRALRTALPTPTPHTGMAAPSL